MMFVVLHKFDDLFVHKSMFICSSMKIKMPKSLGFSWEFEKLPQLTKVIRHTALLTYCANIIVTLH